MKKITYADSGVDITEGNRAVELMKAKVKETYTSGVVGDIGLFAGGFSLGDVSGMEEPVLLASTDGVGTKIMIAQQMDVHDTVGIDLVAMCVNDLICQGAKPLFFLDYIATGNVQAEKIATIVGGIADGCKESLCALIGGETAEMPGLYSKDEYDLAGFSVIGLASTGLHSNGYSLARKLFLETLNLKLDDVYEGMSEPIGKALLRPTRLYVKTILDLISKFNIKGISNITGGGLVENVPRILPKDVDVVIDTESWEYPEIFEVIRRLDMVEKNEMYRSLNMGVGMVLIVSKEESSQIIDWIHNNTQDRAYAIGSVVKGEQKCRLQFGE